MNRRTKFTIGVSLVVSAATTAAAFVALSIKKKSPWQALLAITATEGLVGLALMQDKLPTISTITKPTKIDLDMTDVEFFGEDDLDDISTAMGAELSHTDDEGDGMPRINRDIPRDEEASEADFV